MVHILIVEDDININNLIKETLAKSGYVCIQAFSGSEALLVLETGKSVDLVILDLMLPGVNGEKVLRSIRKKLQVPVIVVSAKDELDTKVDLLTMGADDYITKPFEIKELEARVDVWLRRTKAADNSKEVIVYHGIYLDKSNYEIKVNDNLVNLTRQEYKILELLMTYPNKVFTKQEIYDYAWDEYYVGVDKTINVHISNIRNKLKKYSDQDYIETVWGIGFKMC